MVARLRLVCHGSTSALRASAFPADEPLDELGLAKLAVFAPQVRSADRSWTSPALRARQTAAALDLDAVAEPALREGDYGRWAGQSYEQVQAQAPDDVAAWLRDPAAAPHGGESILALIERVAAWMDGQLQSEGQTVAVTHASVIRAAVVHAIGAGPNSFWRIDVAPLAMARLTGQAGRWTLSFIGPMQARASSVPIASERGSTFIF
jgi:broad specificity phosphatase PhoE